MERLISDKIRELLNLQVNNELRNSHNYLAASTFFDKMQLNGFANYYRKQSNEEKTHAEMFLNYMAELNIEYISDTVEKCNENFKTPLQVSKFALNLEVKTTEEIKNIASVCMTEGDFLTYSFINDMLKEQITELGSADDLYTKLKMIEHDKSALLLLDFEFSK